MRTAADAQRLGVETVYQDLALAPHLDVSANLFLGRETLLPGMLGGLGFIDKKAMLRAASDDLQLLGLRVRETAYVLDAVRTARDERGLSILLVTHDLLSALRIADRVVVLRLGRECASFDARSVSVEQLVGTITGVYDGPTKVNASEADEAVL